MDKKTKIIALIVVAIVVVLVIVGIFLLFSEFLQSSEKHPLTLNVTITDLYSTQAEYGDGRTLFMNITFENNRDVVAHIGNPVIITDQGGELYCNFIKADEGIEFSSGGLDVPANETVHVTIKTWDRENWSECLPEGEKPKYFQYNYGSGIVFAPSTIKVDIPDDLITNL